MKDMKQCKTIAISLEETLPPSILERVIKATDEALAEYRRLSSATPQSLGSCVIEDVIRRQMKG